MNVDIEITNLLNFRLLESEVQVYAKIEIFNRIFSEIHFPIEGVLFNHILGGF